MNSIKLNNFKGYSEPLIINLEGKNMLLCGENGTGKTSLYEAFHLAYHRRSLIDAKFSSSMPEQERIQAKNDILDSYNFQGNKTVRFTLEIDDSAFEQFDLSNKEAYFLDDGQVSYDTINVVKIMQSIHLPNNIISAMQSDSLPSIFQMINTTMHDEFLEDISVELSEEGNWNCIITDAQKGLNRKEKELFKYFNESKLKLLTILLALTIIRVRFDAEPLKDKLLVLDDIVTSMDMMNREMLIRYLLKTFPDVQLIVLTHNISFFNLFSLNLKRFGLKEKWIYRHLYDVAGIHKVYSCEENSVKSLRQRLKDGEDPEKVGNDIRKRFESLVVELARLRGVDSQIETMTNVIEKLIKGQCVYMKRNGDKVSDANDMLSEITALIKNVPTLEILQEKMTKIKDSYMVSNKEFEPFVKILQEITIYQKLVMHQLSHGIQPKATFSIKEQQLSLKLLEKLEEYVNKGHSSNTDGEVAVI